jgi:hypothetical protein
MSISSDWFKEVFMSKLKWLIRGYLFLFVPTVGLAALPQTSTKVLGPVNVLERTYTLAVNECQQENRDEKGPIFSTGFSVSEMDAFLSCSVKAPFALPDFELVGPARGLQPKDAPAFELQMARRPGKRILEEKLDGGIELSCWGELRLSDEGYTVEMWLAEQFNRGISQSVKKMGVDKGKSIAEGILKRCYDKMSDELMKDEKARSVRIIAIKKDR